MVLRSEADAFSEPPEQDAWLDETFNIFNANTVTNTNTIFQNHAVLADLIKEVRLLGLIGKHPHQYCLLSKPHRRLQLQHQRQRHQQLHHCRPRPGTPRRECRRQKMLEFLVRSSKPNRNMEKLHRDQEGLSRATNWSRGSFDVWSTAILLSSSLPTAFVVLMKRSWASSIARPGNDAPRVRR